MVNRIEEPEEELENAGLALFLQERLDQREGSRLSAGDFLQGIGMEEFVATSRLAAGRVKEQAAREGASR